ncbi:hypothetical protein [Kiloniella sp.]|uniref:hypothetical protein n=1 Tax=Kiloniella sp. TaxID=1938587 RepID=UPI003B012253
MESDDVIKLAGVAVTALIALGAMGAYLWRENKKTKNTLRAIYVETFEACKGVRKHLKNSNYDNVKQKIDNDPDYCPFLASHPSPDHLFRKAIDELYLIPNETIRYITKLKKADQASTAYIIAISSVEYKSLDQTRKKQILDFLLDSNEKLQEASEELVLHLENLNINGDKKLKLCYMKHRLCYKLFKFQYKLRKWYNKKYTWY